MINTIRIDYETMRRWQHYLAMSHDDEVEVMSKLINKYINTKEFEQEIKENMYGSLPPYFCSSCDD